MENPVTEPKRSQNPKRPLSLVPRPHGCNFSKNALGLAVLLVALTARPADQRAAPPMAPSDAESALIQQLGASDPKVIIKALNRLLDGYPGCTNAIPAIRPLLKNKFVYRDAARALGDLHAALDLDEVRVILGFLRAYSPNEVMDGLKVLRELDEPEAIRQKIVSDILPLLKDPQIHIRRDACRTLGVIGDKDVIPALEPLLADKRADVKQDALDAIDKLKAK